MRIFVFSNKSCLNFFRSAFAFVLIICIAVLSLPKDRKTVFANAQTENIVTVIIDAGHGGFDGGAVAGDGTVEKDINLSIALKLGEMMSSFGYNVVYTRTSDNGTDNLSNDVISSRKKADLKNRLALMYEFSDAVFVSIHLNKFTSGSAKGAQVFYSPNNDESKVLGDIIQSSIINLVQPENKRICKKAGKDIFLLNNAPLPAVIVECGFLSNSTELRLLKEEEYQFKIAFAVFKGILEYYIK